MTLAHNTDATFAGDVYTTGTSNSFSVISRDNMFVDAGQFYIGADDSVTDDSFRQRTSSGSYFIESRKSGTWTNRLQINSAGTLIASQNATFAGQVQVAKAKSGTGVENYDLLRLNLTGTGAIGDSSTIGWFSTTGTKTAGIEGISGLDNIAYGELAFHVRRYTTDTYDEAMRINNRGNVGIGTDSPDHKLRVNGDTRLGNLHIKTSDFGVGGTGKTIYADGAGSGVLGFISTTAFDFSNGYTSRMHIDSSGRVGIGTASPSSEISGSVTMLEINDATNNNLASLALKAGNQGGKWEIAALNSNALGFFGAGTERMRIDSNGSVSFAGSTSLSNTAASIQHFSTNGYLYNYSSCSPINI